MIFLSRPDKVDERKQPDQKSDGQYAVNQFVHRRPTYSSHAPAGSNACLRVSSIYLASYCSSSPTMSDISHSLSVTPADIAGAVRSVLWMRTFAVGAILYGRFTAAEFLSFRAHWFLLHSSNSRNLVTAITAFVRRLSYSVRMDGGNGPPPTSRRAT